MVFNTEKVNFVFLARGFQMFFRILTTALFAGFIAGVISAVMQIMFLQPILLHAELYETGHLTHFGNSSLSGSHLPPVFDFQRNALSLLFSALIYTGYALILTALFAYASSMELQTDNVRAILFGICGFTTVQLSPAFGLPPELPGVAAAELMPRQIWWFFCVISTGLGFWILAFGGKLIFVAVGIILLLTPHIIGAPQPVMFIGPTPPELASHFASRALTIGLVSWSCLGFLTGYFWRKEDF